MDSVQVFDGTGEPAGVRPAARAPLTTRSLKLAFDWGKIAYAGLYIADTCKYLHDYYSMPKANRDPTYPAHALGRQISRAIHDLVELCAQGSETAQLRDRRELLIRALKQTIGEP